MKKEINQFHVKYLLITIFYTIIDTFFIDFDWYKNRKCNLSVRLNNALIKQSGHYVIKLGSEIIFLISLFLSTYK